VDDFFEDQSVTDARAMVSLWVVVFCGRDQHLKLGSEDFHKEMGMAGTVLLGPAFSWSKTVLTGVGPAFCLNGALGSFNDVAALLRARRVTPIGGIS
jgi:hypothetical protein